MVKGFVMMWSIPLYCFNEQLFCCEWSCLDVVHFIAKTTLFVLAQSNVIMENTWILGR